MALSKVSGGHIPLRRMQTDPVAVSTDLVLIQTRPPEGETSRARQMGRTSQDFLCCWMNWNFSRSDRQSRWPLSF